MQKVSLLLIFVKTSKPVNTTAMKTHYEAPETAVLELTQESVICQQSADFNGMGLETEWSAAPMVTNIEIVDVI